MPYDVVKDGDQWCLEKKDDHSRVPGSCHADRADTERMMRAILMNEHMGSQPVWWVNRDEMRAMCSSCADEMEKRGFDRIDLMAVLAGKQMFAVGVGGDFPGNMPRQMAEGLCNKIGRADPGFFTRCKSAGLHLPAGYDVDAFCAELHKFCTGIWPSQHSGDYLLDNYVSTKPGQPLRQFPFGRLVKGGKVREITPEYAKRFKLPHFKPPIKLGSHDDSAPAGGHIIGLEVHDDGLYALTEITEKGYKSMTDGDYRYLSPEVIWEDGGLEDPSTGNTIQGPLIVGCALLHTPHLGESAALYSIENNEGGNTMEEIKVPLNIFERLMARFNKPEDEAKKPEESKKPEVPEEFTAAVKERDDLKAKIEAMEAAKVKAARVEKFTAALKDTKAEQKPDILASMTDEQADWVVTQFKALSAQIKESALTGELGKDGDGLPEGRAGLNKVIEAYAAEKKLDYNAALEALRAEKPELFKSV